MPSRLSLATATSFLCLAAAALLLCSIVQAQDASPVSLQDHPGWVQIPGEQIRPDCVHAIPNGALVEIEDGKMTGDVTLNGALIAHYEPCSEDPVVTRPHGRTPGLLAIPGTGNGWVETSLWDVSLKSSDDIDLMGGYWTVPSNPSQNGALIYLFNGIEPSTENWILQPVLQYGYNGLFGGNYWVIASWLVGPNGYAFYSPAVGVSPGNSLLGYTGITSTSGSTLYWMTEAKDETSGKYSYITAHSSGLHWTWAFAATLEAYNVTSCKNFPANGRAVFTDSTVAHGFPNYIEITPPKWEGAILSYGGPSCGFKVIAGTKSTLDF